METARLLTIVILFTPMLVMGVVVWLFADKRRAGPTPAPAPHHDGRPWASFDADGRRYEVWLPTPGDAAPAWSVRVTEGQRVIEERSVPMSRRPRFGPAPDDIRALHEAVDAMVAAPR